MLQTRMTIVPKAIILDVLADMPEDIDVEEMLYQVELFSAIAESEKQIAQGQGIPHEEVVRQIEAWLT